MLPAAQPTIHAAHRLPPSPPGQAQSAQNVARGLLASISKLVATTNSPYMFERETSLRKLRDMLDPVGVRTETDSQRVPLKGMRWTE